MECAIFHGILILVAMFPFFFVLSKFEFYKSGEFSLEKRQLHQTMYFLEFFSSKEFSKRAKTLPPNKSLPPQKSVPQGKRHLVLIHDKGKGIIIYYCMGTLR
jgi:hypothetical protein